MQMRSERKACGLDLQSGASQKQKQKKKSVTLEQTVKQSHATQVKETNVQNKIPHEAEGPSLCSVNCCWKLPLTDYNGYNIVTFLSSFHFKWFCWILDMTSPARFMFWAGDMSPMCHKFRRIMRSLAGWASANLSPSVTPSPRLLLLEWGWGVPLLLPPYSSEGRHRKMANYRLPVSLTGGRKE